MAFGGTVTSFNPGVSGALSGFVKIKGGTLAARIGAPDITAADTGQMTTAAVAANQNAIPVDFGRGRGNWVAGDDDNISIVINDPSSAATGSDVHWASTAITAGNLVITVHNKGTVISGALDIAITWDN